MTRDADLKQIHGMGTRTPGGMYSPWITTMSSGHTVTEYELDTSGLQPLFHHKNRGKTDGKSLIFINDFLWKKKTLRVV